MSKEVVHKLKTPEISRVYTFPGGDKVTILGTKEVRVRKSGHYITDQIDNLHIVPSNWIHIEIIDPLGWDNW